MLTSATATAAPTTHDVLLEVTDVMVLVVVLKLLVLLVVVELAVEQLGEAEVTIVWKSNKLLLETLSMKYTSMIRSSSLGQALRRTAIGSRSVSRLQL